MDRFVASPGWHDFIVWYFFLGGIAAGSYAFAALATLFGDESDRRATRGAHYLAFPIVGVCGLLLVVDLGRPERFWHMLIQSETYRPMLKWWSPMSAGSWGLSAFGAFSALSFAGVLVEDGWLPLGGWSARVVGWRRGWPAKVAALGGAVSAFFLGSYTGSLLSATNQPIWAETTWLAPLFLASSASTGLAATTLIARHRLRDVGPAALGRLEHAELWAIGLEGVILVAFMVSLGELRFAAFGRWPGRLIPAFVLPFGVINPPVIRHIWAERGAWAAALLVLAAGFVLRAAVIGVPAGLIQAHL